MLDLKDPRPIGCTVVAMVLAATLLASCSSGSGDEGATATSTAEEATPSSDGDGGNDDAARPGGSWTVVRWTQERTDDPEGTTAGLARVARWRIEPGCDEGPCDLDVVGDGADGTFLPEGVPVLDDGVDRPDALTLEWSDDEQTYTLVDGPRTVSCTSTDAELVPDAYEYTATTTLTYTPPGDDGPAALHGTWTEESESTPAGEAAGCASFRSTGSVAGSPVGAVADVVDDPSGTYTATEIVGLLEPDQRLPVGQAALLGPMSVSADGEATTITGTLGTPATLDDGTDGWTGTAELAGQPCQLDDGSQVAGAYDSTETWTGLAALATTDDGLPILGGPWSSASTPTAAGDAAGCPPLANDGYLILVPDPQVG